MSAMTKKEFTDAVAKETGDRLGSGFEVSAREMLKNNGRIWHGVIIMKKDESVSPTIYVDDFYDEEADGDVISRTADFVIDSYHENMTDNIPIVDFSDFNQIKNGICLRVVNTKENEAYLEQVPHREFLDLSVIYYISLEHNGQVASVTITDSIANIWGVSEEELFDAAYEFTPRMKPMVSKPLHEVISELTGNVSDDGEAMMPEVPMIIVTNEKSYNGAAAILYPEFLEGVMDGNFFILPSSIHEILLLPDDGSSDAELLKAMVKEVNSTQVKPEEKLSDHVYYYDRDTKRVSIVG